MIIYVTIHSLFYLVGLEFFRTILKPKMIGITPIMDYIPQKNASNIGSAWLDYMEKISGHKIYREQHMGPYYADGVNYETKTVYEYWGEKFQFYFVV